jgi:hypothetical protein
MMDPARLKKSPELEIGFVRYRSIGFQRKK